MSISRHSEAEADMPALEAAAASARAGFACMFSTSDEYEDALIAARRAEGRYRPPVDWNAAMLLGCIFILSGAVLIVLS